MNSHIVALMLPNLSDNVYCKEYKLEVPEVSISDLSRLLISFPTVCVCSNNLATFLQKFSSELRNERKFERTLWKYALIQEEIADDDLQKLLLKKEYIFNRLVPLLCRITEQVLLHKSIGLYQTWLKTDGRNNIFYVKIGHQIVTLVVCLNSNKVWEYSLHGSIPEKYQIGDQIFGPVIHDFVK